MLAGLGAGYWLDERFSTRPAFLLLGGSLGVGAGLYHFVKSVLSALKDRTDRKP